MTTCQPPVQNFGSPFGLFCLGTWRCYPGCNDWYWEGTCRTINGGWHGNPFAGYTLELKPTTPCNLGGTPGGGQSTPQPPGPVVIPPLPPPAAGVPPQETPPPQPDGTVVPDPHSQCGPGMATPAAATMLADFGFDADDQAGWPGVGKFLGVNKYASLQTTQGETIQKQTNPTVTVPPYIEKDAQGNIRVLHPSTGPGEVWLSPPELEDYHLAGEHASHTGKLAGVKLPKKISVVGLNIASFKRANSSNGDDVDGYLGWGVYHPTGQYVADGWFAKLTGSVGARNLEFFSTDVNGAPDGAGPKSIKINGAAISTGGGSGDVVGPASATDSAVALFDSTTGKLIKNSTLTFASGVLADSAAETLTVRAAAGQGTAIGRAANTSAVLGTTVNIGDLLAASAVQLSVVAGSTLAGPPQTTTLAGGGLVNSLEDDGTNGYREYIDEEQTTDSTVTKLIDIPRPSASATCALEYIVTGVAAADSTKRIVQREVVEYYDNAGTLTLGTAIEGPNTANSLAAGGTITAIVSGTNIRITVRGAAATTINWGVVAKVSWRNTTT